MVDRGAATQRLASLLVGVALTISGCAVASPSATASVPGSAGPSQGSTSSSAASFTPGPGVPTMEMATGSMLQARNGETATLLKNGRVLVAGGAFGDALASAEIYDPMSGTWSATANMTTPRYHHTATLLADGTVLVAGGSNEVIDPVAQPSAELYDPATGAWTPTGAMIEGRQAHTATLLPNGRVLVVGGTTGGGAPTTAQLYDPATRSWAATGSAASGRIGHTATLLLGGKVLVAGGFDSYASGEAWAPSELFDPGTGLWTPTGSMFQPGFGETATLLLDGRVLVAGGGSRIPDSAYNSAELYDPTTGSWTPTPPMAQAHQGHAALLLPDGRVMVAGGGSGGGALTVIELYDPARGRWQSDGEMLNGRAGHTATLLQDGRVLIVGGCCDAGGGTMASAELFSATP